MDQGIVKLLPAVRGIAREAGEVILRYYTDTVTAHVKADGSPVTAADNAAEAVILPALHHLTPDIPVISEEQHAAGKSPPGDHGTYWLVDPLDGTKGFIEHTGEFTVNIGLIKDGVPVLGVMYLPVDGDTYAAAGPGTAVYGARARHDVPISCRVVPADGLVVLSSRRHGDRERLDKFLEGKLVKEHRHSSSALKFCLIARGEVDIYPRFGPTCEWDTAAGHAILLAAGGSIETPDGQSLAYGKPRYLNGEFIAYGRK
ncbi:3'-5'-bisphosphate nucleotidase [Skermanella stibiiresistens SB22]|uniref:3'(2'),5'-bisphosphate nucleotidase CysQ n=1 Tax=Skermanella stibiiresistens SB22 TaxID=1385369 RepID=W9H0W0_9PROT|nr:3'-5'-bisphosphate nucleotidase [Skermanella stibiiresistens SB22]